MYGYVTQRCNVFYSQKPTGRFENYLEDTLAETFEYNNRDEDGIMNDESHQVLSQIFRQLISSRHGPDIIRQWRQLERLNQKLTRMTNHLTFLCRCQDLKLVLPGLKIPVNSRKAWESYKKIIQ